MNNSITELKGSKASKSIDETLAAASLNWKPLSGPVRTIGTDGEGITVPRKKVLYRSDNNQPLGIVGGDYCATDPMDFMKVQFQMAEKMGGEVTRAGFIEDRSRMFAFVKLQNINVPVEYRKKGDPLSVHVYSTDGWDGMTPRRYRLYLERLACTNGARSTDLTASLWVSHTSSMESRHALRWEPFMAEVGKTIKLVRDQFTQLAAAGLKSDEMSEFLKKLIPGEAKMTENRRNEIGKLFTEEGGGIDNHGKTRWDAYNAVTQYVTHNRTYRKTDATSEDTNRFLGVLETDNLSTRALNLLLN